MVIERDDVVWPVVRPDNHNLDPADHAGYDGHAAYPATTWTDSGCTRPRARCVATASRTGTSTRRR